MKLTLALFVFVFLVITLANAAGNGKKCRENEVFNTCGTNCPPTCNDPNPICNKACKLDVCQCRRGYVLNNKNICIPLSKCPKRS